MTPFLPYLLSALSFALHLRLFWPGPATVRKEPPKAANTPRRSMTARRNADDSLARLCDMTALGLSAGLILPEALSLAIAPASGNAISDTASPRGFAAELRGLDSLRKSGLSFSECLAQFESDAPSERVRQLCARLRFAVRMGQELVPCLEGLAAEERRLARHAWEERTARLPVLMLFPIAFALLPALFVFLSGPSIAESLSSDEGPATSSR